jgi:ribonuclease HI
MSVRHTCLSIIQEPWIHKGRIRGLNGCGTLFFSPETETPRTCIIAKGLDAVLMPDFTTRDLVTVSVKYKGPEGTIRQVIVGAAYFPYDSDQSPPTAEVVRLVSYCNRKGLDLLIGCDANSHHVVWGSSDNNQRGMDLLDYIYDTGLEILNRGREPTFSNINREEVIDITLCTGRLVRSVVGWRVSLEPSLSDHRHILYELISAPREITMVRSPKATDWASYRQDLGENLRASPSRSSNTEEVEILADFITQAVTTSFENNCPERKIWDRSGTPWWNNHLQGLRKETRRLFNRAKKSKSPRDTELFRQAQRVYKNAIKARKQMHWEKFCSEIEQVKDAARLSKVLAKNTSLGPGFVKLPTGTYTSSREETIRHLLETHFPGYTENPGDVPIFTSYHANPSDWKLARMVITYKRVDWALKTFHPYKSPGTDGIHPILLREGKEHLCSPLTHLFRASLAMGYLPEPWREARVVFIPKPGNLYGNTAKSFRPISLTSFLLKSMEKLIDRYIRDEVLSANPLHSQQHAYRAGKSTETALHSAVSRIEEQIEGKGFAVGAFLDIAGAFDNTSTEVICAASSERGVPETITRWIRNMLCRRRLTVNQYGTSTKGSTDRGCPQGGVLSPLLWCLVVDELIRTLNEAGFYTVGYADDILIIVRGLHIQTLMELTQTALNLVRRWCNRVGLTVNPAKTEIVVFTRKYKWGPVKGPIFYDKELQIAQSAKYLGVILDKGLRWKEHLDKQAKNFSSAMWACRGTLGRTWGLRPAMVQWLYTAVLRPRLMYAAIIWWPRTDLVSAKATLDKLQGCALRGTLGALRTSPTASLEAALGIPPLHISIKAAAGLTAYKLQCQGNWRTGITTGHSKISNTVLSKPIFRLPSDICTVQYHFEARYTILVPKREDWDTLYKKLEPQGDIYFTDGSKCGNESGAGVYSPRGERAISIALGRTATVIQAEMYAILYCVQLLEAHWGIISGKAIWIFSDSQAALAALDKPVTNSKLVRDCKESLNRLGSKYKITLSWVPGHSGIHGNEMADKLAKEGCSKPSPTRPPVGVPLCVGKEEVLKWINNESLKHWQTTAGCRQAKLLMGTDKIGTRAKQLLQLDRKQARLAIGLLTGHCTLRYHMSNMGLSMEKSCRACCEEDETSMHVLCECPAFARLRHNIFGQTYMHPNDLCDRPIREILDFIKRTELLE